MIWRTISAGKLCRVGIAYSGTDRCFQEGDGKGGPSISLGQERPRVLRE